MTDTNSDTTAHQTVDRVAAGAHKAVDRFAESTNAATDTLEAKGKHIKEVQEVWFDNVRGYVRANPGTSLGIAVVGGFLLSRVMSSH